MPIFFDPLELAASALLAVLLIFVGYLFLSLLSDGIDAVAPPPAPKNRVPKEAPRQLDVSGVFGPDDLAHFVVVNARRWPHFRQHVLVRIDDEAAPWVWVTAYTAPDGVKRFDYNLDDY